MRKRGLYAVVRWLVAVTCVFCVEKATDTAIECE